MHSGRQTERTQDNHNQDDDDGKLRNIPTSIGCYDWAYAWGHRRCTAEIHSRKESDGLHSCLLDHAHRVFISRRMPSGHILEVETDVGVAVRPRNVVCLDDRYS